MNRSAIKNFIRKLKVLFISFFYDGIGQTPKWIESLIEGDDELSSILNSHKEIANRLKDTSEHWAKTKIPAPIKAEDYVARSANTSWSDLKETGSNHWTAWGLGFAVLVIISLLSWNAAHDSANKVPVTISHSTQNPSIEVSISAIVVPRVGLLGISHSGIAAVDTLSNSIKDSYLRKAEIKFQETTKSFAEIPLNVLPEELVSSTLNLMNSSIN